MMGAFAGFERNIIKKRQAEGIAKAKARGVYKGSKKRIDREKVHQLKADGYSTYKIADLILTTIDDTESEAPQATP